MGRLGNEQDAEHKDPEQPTSENDAAEETVSVLVKLAKEPLEPDDIDLQTPERRDDSRPVQGGGENTDERVKALHTEMCEKSEKLEEGYDVDGRHAPQSDATACILKQWKDETSADSSALEKKGLEKTNRQGLMKAETLPRATRPPPWRDKQTTSEYGRKSKNRCDRNESMLWLAASYLEYNATIQEGVMNFMRISMCWNSSKDNTRSITKMMKTNWNVMVSSRNRKHVSQSMMTKANNKIICYLKEDWLQEFRENHVDDRVPERRDSHASSSHEVSLEPTFW